MTPSRCCVGARHDALVKKRDALKAALAEPEPRVEKHVRDRLKRDLAATERELADTGSQRAHTEQRLAEIEREMNRPGISTSEAQRLIAEREQIEGELVRRL